MLATSPTRRPRLLHVKQNASLSLCCITHRYMIITRRYWHRCKVSVSDLFSFLFFYSQININRNMDHHWPSFWHFLYSLFKTWLRSRTRPPSCSIIASSGITAVTLGCSRFLLAMGPVWRISKDVCCLYIYIFCTGWIRSEILKYNRNVE